MSLRLISELISKSIPVGNSDGLQVSPIFAAIRHSERTRSRRAYVLVSDGKVAYVCGCKNGTLGKKCEPVEVTNDVTISLGNNVYLEPRQVTDTFIDSSGLGRVKVNGKRVFSKKMNKIPVVPNAPTEGTTKWIPMDLNSIPKVSGPMPGIPTYLDLPRIVCEQVARIFSDGKGNVEKRVRKAILIAFDPESRRPKDAETLFKLSKREKYGNDDAACQKIALKWHNLSRHRRERWERVAQTEKELSDMTLLDYIKTI